MAKSGQGRRTRQYNPGAKTLGAYAEAVATHTRGAHDEGGRIIHETPKSKRREYASEIWERRRAHGNPPSSFETIALKRLASLPVLDPSVWDRQGLDRESGDWRRSPFKGSQSASAARTGHQLVDKLQQKYGSYESALDDAPLKRVRLSSLHGVQPGVRSDIIEQKIREIAESDELEAPSVARHKGKLYLLDGSHTSTALKLGGVGSVQAKVMAA